MEFTRGFMEEYRKMIINTID